MKRLIAFEFLSLDGFMAGPPGHEMDFVTAGFDNDMEQDLAAQYATLDAFVMGKTTFQNLAGYWPTPMASAESLQPVMNSMQKLEYRFFIFPAALGVGKPLFAREAAPGPLKLLQTKRFAAGVIRADYVRA